MFCKFLVVISGAVLGILSGIVFLAALALFFAAGFWPGIADTKKPYHFLNVAHIQMDNITVNRHLACGDLRTFRKQAEMPLISSGRHGKILIEG